MNVSACRFVYDKKVDFKVKNDSVASFQMFQIQFRKSDGTHPVALLDLAADVIYQTMYIREQRSLTTTDPAVHRGKCSLSAPSLPIPPPISPPSPPLLPCLSLSPAPCLSLLFNLFSSCYINFKWNSIVKCCCLLG